jgi:hypothetical protein
MEWGKRKGGIYIMTGKWVEDAIERVWRIGTEFIRIDDYEDCSDHSPEECNCQEVWVGDDNSGNWDSEGIFDSIEKAEQYVKDFMKENPNGWLSDDKAKTEQEAKEKVQFT